MKDTPFVLNNRFLVNPVITNLSDRKTGKEVRLEPRLMNVLCFLAANVNQLVTREQLIAAIWNNYGGADEGLNQAISFLRKLLDDPGKKIIETIPTKGYLLNANVTDDFITEEKIIIKQTSPKGNATAEITPLNILGEARKFKIKKVWIASLILVVIIAAVTVYLWTSDYWDDRPLQYPQMQPMPAIKTEVKPVLIYKPKRELPPRDSAGQPGPKK